MKTIDVGLGQRSYPIYIEAGLLQKCGEFCRKAGLGKRCAIVTNPKVGGLYATKVRDALSTSGFDVVTVEIPDGEEHKNIHTLNGIYDQLIGHGLDRGSFIVALGGGVVGDIAGYAAASFLRGIPFVQVPTTLLAQVDSSVGGKTGINHPKGKNLIGAFYQPRLVLIDTDTLQTLEKREYLSGLAEVVKYGVVLDKDLFSYLERHVPELLSLDNGPLSEVIAACCRLKSEVVEKDEKEESIRAVLNYGHTLGHVVETLTGYIRFKHGEAVAIGMVQAARISEDFGYATHNDSARIEQLLKQLELPRELPACLEQSYLDVMFKDKKVRDGGINFVFNKGIGEYVIDRVTDLSRLLKICGVEG